MTGSARRSGAELLLAATALFFAAGLPSEASAEAPKKVTQADRDAARTFAEQGFEKFQQRKYSDAIALFLKAEEHFHAPSHVAFIARAHERRGELIEAADTYRKLLAEPLAKDAPQPFRQAYAEASPALEAIVRRIPKLRVDVTGEGADRARITASDRPFTAGVSTPTNPGTVIVRVITDDPTPLERTVTLPEKNTEVTVHFEIARPYSIAWPVSALALGFAGGAASIATGIYSHNLAVGAERFCSNMVECPQAQLDQMAESQKLRDVSIGAGIAGGVFLAGGVTLLILRHGPRSSVEPPSASALASSPNLAVRVGPSFVGVSASF